MKITKLKLVPNVARILNVHKMTLYRWIDKGKIPVFEIDGIKFIHVKDIEKIRQKERLRD